MKVSMVPHLWKFRSTESGVKRVVEAYFRHLPAHGVELVAEDAATYDMVADHAGAAGGAALVDHNHGLWWTADHDAPGSEMRSNANVIEALRCARIVTVPSDWVAENIMRDMRVRPRVVPHGIEWEAWQGGTPDGGYVLWNKNRPSAVCDPRWTGALARRFPELNFVATFVEEDDADLPNVSVTGLVPHADMKRTVMRAGVYLATTKETGGIGTLEAMAAGIPVLGFRRGGILDMVEHKVHGWLAEPGDEEGLAEGLLWCRENRAAAGAAGRERARDFRWEDVCRTVAGIYAEAMRPEPPTVTVAVPVYNYAGMVGRAVASVRAQTWTDFHCVVVDDGSTDGSYEAALEAAGDDSRFRVVRQENAGVAHARNAGIAAGDGKYACCLDADDAMEPGFLEACVGALEGKPCLDIAYTALRWIEPDGRTGIGAWPPAMPDFGRQMTRANQVPTCCVFRRGMWERLGGYRQRYAPQGAGAEDAELWLRAGAAGSRAERVTDDALFNYSHLSGRVSGNENYSEEDWTAWHPWTRDGRHPFASVAKPKKWSHPVRQYDEPLVSVVVPVGPGHEKFLVDALDSVEAQGYRRWEVVVVDDAGGPPLEDGWWGDAYPFVRWVRTEGEKGAGFARNRGIVAARGRFFVPLDADDYLQPEFMDVVLRAWNEMGREAWVYSDIWSDNGAGEVQVYECGDWDVDSLWKSGLAPVTALYEKSDWEAVGGFDEGINWEDWDFHLRLAKGGKCGLRVPLPLVTYRLWSGMRRNKVERFGAEGKREAAAFLRSRYPLEGLMAGCRGCGGKKIASPARVVANPGRPGEGWAELEYVGKNREDRMYRGAGGGRKYMFGNNAFNKRQAVHPDDVDWLLRFAVFKRPPAAPTDAPSLEVKRKTEREPVETGAPGPEPTSGPVQAGLIPLASKPAPAPTPTPSAPKPAPAPVAFVPPADVPDPADLTVREIAALEMDQAGWAGLLVRERAGKGRKTALEFADKMRLAGILFRPVEAYGHAAAAEAARSQPGGK